MHRRSFLALSALWLARLGLERHLAAGEAPRRGPEGRPNFLILLFDAFSARHASLYGYPRETTPQLAQLAAGATVFHAHYSAGNFTVPGVASLLTGTYPWSHRALHESGAMAQGATRNTLFRLLRDRGYNTLAYAQNLWADLLLGQLAADIDTDLDPGAFSLLDLQPGRRLFARDAATASRTLEDLVFAASGTPGSPVVSQLLSAYRTSAQARLRRDYEVQYPRGLPDNGWAQFRLEDAVDGVRSLLRAARQPFLAYCHLLPPHDGYRPRREFTTLFRDGWAPVRKQGHFFSTGWPEAALDERRREYDQYVAHVDAELGRLYGYLAEYGMLDNTWLVVTSDHGEMFERGIWQHTTPTLYEPVLRVPLLIWRPGQTQRRDVYTPTSAVDLLPTLCRAVGEPVPGWCEGEVLPGFSSQAPDPNRSIYVVEAKQNPQRAPLAKATVAMIKGRYKLIHYLGYAGYEDEYELYDLEADPEEMEDLYAAQPAAAAELRAEMLGKLAEVNRPYRR